MSRNIVELDIRVPNQTRYLSLIGKIGEDIAREIDRFSEDRETLAFQINLVLTEAMANAIKHAVTTPDDDSVHIQISMSEKTLFIRIFDSGQGFDINNVKQPDFEKLDDKGRGIFIIKTLMDSVQYLKCEEGNVLEMIKKFV